MPLKYTIIRTIMFVNVRPEYACGRDKSNGNKIQKETLHIDVIFDLSSRYCNKRMKKLYSTFVILSLSVKLYSVSVRPSLYLYQPVRL
jgi:hypothetical protein